MTRPKTLKAFGDEYASKSAALTDEQRIAELEAENADLRRQLAEARDPTWPDKVP